MPWVPSSVVTRTTKKRSIRKVSICAIFIGLGPHPNPLPQWGEGTYSSLRLYG